MKLTILTFCLLVAVATAIPDAEWKNYKMKHAKVYENEGEELMRKALVARQRDYIERFNAEKAEEAGYKLGLNHLSDRSAAEIKQMRGYKSAKELGIEVKRSPKAQRYIQAILNDNSLAPPKSFDWRKTPGRVGRVKDQGQCGSCWAFSTTGTLEGQERVLRKSVSNVTELSEQNLVDCSTDNLGCDGGNPSVALAFIAKEGGIDSEESYPYEAEQDICMHNKSNVVITDAGAGQVPEGNEEALMKILIAHGPVSVAIDASQTDFQPYESGVYYNKQCSSSDLDHAVLVVGYGSDEKYGDYWIVKNSWAEDWGDHGYIKMARNKNNNCGIASDAYIPVFK